MFYILNLEKSKPIPERVDYYLVIVSISGAYCVIKIFCFVCFELLSTFSWLR